MAEATCPIVLIIIDENSRLRILQHTGVTVALIERRVDPKLVILPDADQSLEIDAAVSGTLPILSLHCDDEAKTAAETIRRLLAREIVVAATKEEPEEKLALRPIHMRLLRRGEKIGNWIWLTDEAGMHTAEVVALGQLHRAGLVEPAKGPFPPGPPSPTPYVITEAGLAALAPKQEGHETQRTYRDGR